jgi:hypothetical protein
MPFISFRDYYHYLLEESSRKNESVINKISKLFLLKDPERVLDKFKEIFDINDSTIKLEKVEIGGNYNPKTNIVSYSTINSLIHEMLHYLQEKSRNEYEYIPPKFDDCGLLHYIYQATELNNWALSLADDAQEYNSFDMFLRSAKHFDDFQKLHRSDRIKHIIYLITQNTDCPERTKSRHKLLKLMKQYYLTIKTLRRNREDFYLVEINEPFI